MVHLPPDPQFIVKIIHQIFQGDVVDPEMLEKFPLESLLQLDINVRRTRWIFDHQQLNTLGWLQIDQSWVDQNSGWLLQNPTLLYLLACHTSGKVRQSATGLLGQVDTVTATALLLIRANDWASEVSGTATRILQDRITLAFLDHWIDAHALLDRLNQNTRNSGALLKTGVHELFSTDQGQKRLLQRFHHQNEPTRAALLPLIRWSAAGVVGDGVILKEKSLRIRRKAVPLVGPHVLNHFLTDSDSKVRELSLQRVFQEGVHSQVAVQHALLDSRFRVRVLAQHFCQEMGQVPIQEYRSLIAGSLSPSQQEGLVAGLADIGTKEDLKTLGSFALHPQSKIRAQAIRGIARIDPTMHVDLLEKAVLDVGQVARVALQALVHNDLSNEAMLQRLWQQACSETQQRRIMRLAITLPRHQAVAVLLEWRNRLDARAGGAVLGKVELLLKGHGLKHHLQPSEGLKKRILQSMKTQKLPKSLLETLKLVVGQP